MSRYLYGTFVFCIAALSTALGFGNVQAAAFPEVTANKSNIADPTPPAAPPKPFFASLDVNSSMQAVGPGNSKIVITNITLTNFSSSVQSVYVFAPIFASGAKKCADQVVGGSEPGMNIEVQPNQTISLPFPSGLVFHGFTPNCVAVQGQGANVDAYLTGYTQ